MHAPPRGPMIEFGVRLLGGLLVIALGPPARAERALQVLVDHDGRRVLESEVFGVSDGDDEREAARMAWRSLDEIDLRPVGDPAQDPGGARKELTGRVRVAVVWGGPARPLAAAAVERLHLVRTPGGGDRWRLTRGEVERTAAAAGLALADARRPARVAALAAAALVGVVAWAWLRRGRRRTPPEPRPAS